MPRFLHTADWQIGRQYGQFPPDDAIPLAEARFKAVERIAAQYWLQGMSLIPRPCRPAPSGRCSMPWPGFAANGS